MRKIETVDKFIEDCTEKFGVNIGVCHNTPELYHLELRNACSSNACGNYGKCHTCPPNIGTAQECIDRVSVYDKILVIQKVYPLEDSYDYPGMVEAQRGYHDIMQGVAEIVGEYFDSPMVLGAGGCILCERCAAKDGEKCRFPHKALVSLEANCIQVSELAIQSGLKYINGINTVTYFGAVLLKESDYK